MVNLFISMRGNIRCIIVGNVICVVKLFIRFIIGFIWRV